MAGALKALATSLVLIAASADCLPAARAGVAAPAGALSFTLKEHFGVAHPDQIVVFDLGRKVDPAAMRMVGPDGREVPFQLLEDGTRLATRTDLPPRAERTWLLEVGRAAAPHAEAVTVEEKGPCIEVANGLLGVRLPRTAEGFAATPAPIQGLRYRDGTWTATGPNLLTGAAGPLTAAFVERGPLLVSIAIGYRTQYKCTVTIRAGQPSVLIEDEAAGPASYTLDVRAGLNPTEARYEGHHSTSVAAGREADGRQYRPNHERNNCEAIVDLAGERELPPLAIWDPWSVNTGYHWQMYNKDAGPEGNVFGIYSGRISRAVAIRKSAIRLWCGEGAAGIRVSLAPEGQTAARLNWGIFLGVKGRDLRPADEPQGINLQANLHGGINLTKLAAYGLEGYGDPPQGYGAMYMPRQAVEEVIRRARTDDAFYRRLYEDGYTRPLFEMWREPAKAAGVLERVVDFRARPGQQYSAFALLDAWVNRFGIRSIPAAYWHGGLNMSRHAIWIDQAMANPAISAADRVRLKAAAALFAGVLWDNDFVPMDNHQWFNMGTPNMPMQQAGYRNLYAMFLPGHPGMRDRAAAAARRAVEELAAQVNEHGAHMGCTHYIGAAMGPTLSSLQQAKMAGLGDAFRDVPRLGRYAQFELQLTTPPEPRAGNLRRRIATGDAEPAEATEILGQLATGFADVEADLAARLMWAWRRSGAPHSSFHGTTAVKIDERLADRDPQLGGAAIPGYLSVLRSGWGGPGESALWLIDGDYYRDHRHEDMGEVVLYALCSPLSLDFGSMYSPHAFSGLIHSTLAPASANWRAAPADGRESTGTWASLRQQEAFRALPAGGHARSSFKGRDAQWVRAVSLAEVSPGQPVFAIQDTLKTAKPLVFSLNLMADGAVQTPEGSRSVGQGFAIAPGVNRLCFTGQTFEKHPTKGIDWDLYVVAPKRQEAFLSQWSHKNRMGESQHILRIQGDDAFRVFIVPFPKGRRPQDIQVKQAGTDVPVSVAGKTVTFRSDGSFSNGGA